MSQSCIETLNQEGKVFVRINGAINEDFDFSKVPLNKETEYIIDLEGTNSINSCGIREWVKWISQANPQKIQFHKCPKVIVDQINMVQGFLPKGAKVISFFVPYYNEDTGSEKNVLLEYGKDFDESGVRVPENVKDDQGNPMEIDVIESKYFKFLTQK